jgi:hypothetical protein
MSPERTSKLSTRLQRPLLFADSQPDGDLKWP